MAKIPLGQPGAEDWWNSYNNPYSIASLDRMFKGVRESGAAGFQAQRSRLNQDFSDLETRLREEAARGQSSLEERQNQLGLLQSGQTGAGIGKIRSDLTSNLARKDIERTIAEADLALKEAGFGADISSKALDLSNTYRQKTGSEDLTKSKLASDLLLNPSSMNIPFDTLKQILATYGIELTD